MKSAVLYVWTEEASKEEMLNQADFLIDYIKGFGEVKIVRVYFDSNGWDKNSKITGLCELLTDALNKKIDCIVIRSLSRPCSDYVKLLALLKLLRHLNIRLISVDEKYDSFSESSREVLGGYNIR